MRRQRRLGLALVGGSAACIVGVLPLARIVIAYSPRFVAAFGLSAAIAEVLTAVTAAHFFITARDGDRTRSQALCTWLGGTALALAGLGVVLTIVVTAAVAILASIPWCGVCGT